MKTTLKLMRLFYGRTFLKPLGLNFIIKTFSCVCSSQMYKFKLKVYLYEKLFLHKFFLSDSQDCQFLFLRSYVFLGCNSPEAQQYADGRPLKGSLADLQEHELFLAARCHKWGQKWASLSANDMILKCCQMQFFFLRTTVNFFKLLFIWV